MDNLEWFKKLRQSCGDDLYSVIISKMIIEKYPSDFTLVKQGDRGNKFYVILQGEVGVFVNNDEQLSMINVCREGQGIGELSIITNQPRMATLICLTDCIFASLTASQYRRFVMQNDKQRISTLIAKIDKVSIFDSLSKQGKIMMMLCMKELEVIRKQVIYKEGQQAKNLYIIIEGQFRLSTKSKQQCIIQENEIFGDLMMEECYTETVECETQKGKLLTISKKTFHKVLQSNGQLFVLQNIKQYAQLKHIYKVQIKKDLSISNYEPKLPTEPYESTRTLYYKNGVYLSDKILIRSNRQVMLQILQKSKLRRPILSITVPERKRQLDSGLRLRCK